jgi:putative ABC transport system permease protein
MAMGSKRRDIVTLFISEGGLLGLLGSIAGTILSVILAIGISAVGIPMPPPPGSNRGFDAEILLSWQNALVAITLVTITALVASLYPAWKASRLEIVDALRHNK